MGKRVAGAVPGPSSTNVEDGLAIFYICSRLPFVRFSDAEWTVMNALWAEAPASARDVLERTAEETDWAYTTVKTLLHRLVEKGALREERRGKTAYYEPVVSRPEARQTALRGLLDRAFDGTLGGLFQHLAKEERLSKKDRDRLGEMLAELDERKKTKRGRKPS